MAGTSLSTIRRRAVRTAAAILLLLAAATLALWLERRRLAGWAVDRTLAKAGVPGRYRLVAIGPRTQVIADVVLGDPARPDLTARRLVLGWRYGLTGPHLASVRADGVRLRGSWADGRLSLGSLDRLLPQGRGGGASLPDLAVSLDDAAASLLLPIGRVGLRLAGSGNLRDGFRGTLRGMAGAVTAAGCVGDAVAGTFAITTTDGAPRLRGPLTLGQLACPGLGLHAGPGRIAADLRVASGFDRLEGMVRPAGLSMTRGGVTLGPIGGVVTIAAAPGRVQAEGELRAGPFDMLPVHAAAVTVSGRVRAEGGSPEIDGKVRLLGVDAGAGVRRAIASVATAMAGTPLAPLGRQLGPALARLVDNGEMLVPIRWAGGTLAIDGATLRDAATLTARVRHEGDGWTGQAQLVGTDLPDLRLTFAQAGAGWRAEVRAAPYRAPGAALTLAPLRLVGGGGQVRFATAATLSGPLADGRIEGLHMPLAGTIGPAGAMRLEAGCVPVRFASLALAGAVIGPSALRLCGDPLVVSDRGGLRVRATARDVVLRGRSGSAPLLIQAGQVGIGNAGFAVDRLAVRLGTGEDPTGLAVARLTGDARLSGRFEGAAGSIANVPLALSGGTGTWALDGGTLRLAGALGVADRGGSARFRPLASDDVMLTLANSVITATGSLHLPGRTERVTDVRLTHDLATGRGRATLAVPGLTFARRGLQPDMLTPLTLGVVANVAGTIRGGGEIAWDAAGTTSTGTFATDRLDLAAAFGPVSGIAGTLRFTDLLGLVSAPHQELRIAELNPGVPVTDGVAHYQLRPEGRVAVEGARWPFAGGTLTLAPTELDFAATAERRLTFVVAGLDAGRFLQQLDLPNISATGTFDGRLPMIFDDAGGRIEGGSLASRGPGTLAYVGELTTAQLGTIGKLAFDALKAIRYNRLAIKVDGRLDGEMVSLVRFDGVRQATAEKGIVARAIRNLPFRFNIAIRAPFRALAGSARSYADPALLLRGGAVQPVESAPVRQKVQP